MKKVISAFIIIILLFSESCIDDVSVTDAPKKNSGKLVLKSEPDSAKIFLLGTDMDKTTPDSVLNLQSGDYDVTLKLKYYRDTSFIATIYDKLRTEILIDLTALPEVFSIFIDSDPLGAEIFLSGKSTRKFTPDSLINLDKSAYTITLKKENYIDTTFTVVLEQDLEIDKSVVLKREELGNIFVQSNPDSAEIFLFENNTGKITPDSILNLKEGSYDLTLKLQGYRDTSFNMSVVKNKTTDIDILLSPSENHVNADLSYNVYAFDQIVFNFHFDKDIKLYQVEVLKPGSTEPSTFNFDNSSISSGDERIIVFAEAQEGEWTFTFHGSILLSGINQDFIIAKKIEVDD